MFHHLFGRDRKPRSLRRDVRAPSRRQRSCRPQLEALEQRLALTQYIWTGEFGSLWSWHENWADATGLSNNGPPYGDPSAELAFYGDGPLTMNTEHDSISPTTMQSMAFYSGGYSLSARPGAAAITLTGDVFSDMKGGTSTISLPLNFDFSKPHEFQVNGDDTIVLSGSGNLSGGGQIRKVGSGTLVMSGDHYSFQGFIQVAAGTLLVGSDNGLGNDESILVERGGLLDLNNHDETLNFGDSQGEIRLGSGNLTLNGHFNHFYGDINGTGGLTLSGNTHVTLDGRQNYTGPTRLLSGTLAINGSSARSPITISSGASLFGRGTTGALTVRGLVERGDGQLGKGVLQSNGDVTFLPGSSFEADIRGLNPGDGGIYGYDQLNVNGRVDLSGSPKLYTSVAHESGFASHPGDTFTILTSSDGITGTFAGLPDGTNFGVDGTPMQIHYTANSVVLTHRPQFAPPVPYAAGRGPTLVATGDFRGNGIKDLVTANYSEGTVNVLLGNGDGTFQAAVSYAVANVPTSVTVGDFNGDGHLDLVTTSFAAGVPTMSVLLGNGDGTFQAAATYPLDRQAWAVAAGDFNHDGSLDLVMTNLYEGTVSVLLGNGDGTFQTAVTYPVSRNPNLVAVGDLGNGKLDIVTAGYANGSVLLGNGDGTFQPAINFDIGTVYFTSIALGDFNGDGKLDLIATANNFVEGSVHVFLGKGDGTFAPQGRIFVGDQPGNVAVGDFDGDGKLDFVVTSNQGLALVYGQGDGSFRAPSYYYVTPGLFSLAVDSFQGKRFPDVAVINADAVSGYTLVSVLLNVGDGNVPPPAPPQGHGRPSPVAAFFPGDGVSRITGAALRALPSSAGAPTSLTPSPLAMTPVLEVLSVERFFAVAARQDHGFAWSRSKREALLGTNAEWVDDAGKGGMLVDRPFPATHFE